MAGRKRRAINRLRAALQRPQHHVRMRLHEVKCAECRVTWRSWAQRIVGIKKGFTPYG